MSVNATYDSLLQKRQQLEQDLRNIEKQIYDLEGSYLEESCQFGNILRGWDGYFSGTVRRSVKDGDRIFSLSSVTAPQVQPENSAPSKSARLEERKSKQLAATSSNKKRAKYEAKLSTELGSRSTRKRGYDSD